MEQLHAAGYQVTVGARMTSDTTFLERLGVNVVRLDFRDRNAIASVIDGNEVVYNCTADANVAATISMDAEVEIRLTKTLVQSAAEAGARRFIQLSTIVVYDFQSTEPIDESYRSVLEYPIQTLALQRETIVQKVGSTHGIETIVLRPASTIGERDKKSFFTRLYAAYSQDKYPLIDHGLSQVSLVDTRDIGRAMAWLGTVNKPSGDNGIYLLKGFDTTWADLKREIDGATGKRAKVLEIPSGLTEEQMGQYGLNSFTVKSFTINRLWDDSKIRNLGFEPIYSLREAVVAEMNYLRDRTERVGN